MKLFLFFFKYWLTTCPTSDIRETFKSSSAQIVKIKDEGEAWKTKVNVILTQYEELKPVRQVILAHFWAGKKVILFIIK